MLTECNWTRRKWDFERANWSTFSRELDNNINHNPYIQNKEDNNVLDIFIHKSAKESVPRCKRKRWIPFWQENHIDDLINLRRKARKEATANPSVDSI